MNKSLERSRLMSKIRHQGTSPELKIRKLLREMGAAFDTNVASLPGNPDLANRTEKWAILVHGCFWHRHMGCQKASIPNTNRAFWVRKFTQNRKRDALAIRKLKATGYSVLVLWECELVREPVVRKKIVSFLTKKGVPPNSATHKQTLCGLNWIRRTRWPRVAKLDPVLAYVDLFCGCGGLSLGVWEAARSNSRVPQVKLAVDVGADAISVYRENFQVSDKIALTNDLRELFNGKLGEPLTDSERTLRRKISKLDLLVAGPPCQGHSDLNNSTRRDDPRNCLYLTAVRAVEVLKPRAAIIENVPAVIHDKAKVLDRAIAALLACGYSVAPGVINALNLDLPQSRKRHLLVAARGQIGDWTAQFQAQSSPCPLSRFLSGIEDEFAGENRIFFTPSMQSASNQRRIAYLFKNGRYDLPNRYRPQCHRTKAHSYVSMYGRLRWDRPAQTITSGFGSMGQGRFVHPKRERVLTPHEAARIQGFPDFFSFKSVKKRTCLHEMIGNAVPPRISAAIVQWLFHEGIL